MQRLVALCGLPIALGGIFMSAHGLIGTLASFFAQATNDPSIQYRTHDYPLAEQLWQGAPLFGHGPGTYIPVDSLNIFDNQYLSWVVELGLVGCHRLRRVPASFRRSSHLPLGDAAARRSSASCAPRWPEPGFAAALCSLTFDSFSFPMFVNVYALVIGLIGACWRLAAAEQAAGERAEPGRAARRRPHRIPIRPARSRVRRAGS